MVRAVIGVFLVAAAAGCNTGSIRAYEGQYCSTAPGDDPEYVCSPSADLVCITTKTVLVTHEREVLKWEGGVRPVYVCRLACNEGDNCPQESICCKGTIFGKTYGKTGGCVPPTWCQTEEEDAGVAPRRDGGADAAAAH